MLSQLEVKVSGEKVSVGTRTELMQRRKDNMWTQQAVAENGFTVESESPCDPMAPI